MTGSLLAIRLQELAPARSVGMKTSCPQHEAHQPAARPRPAHADRGAGRTDADLAGPDRRRPPRAHPERRQRRRALARDHRAAARPRWRAGRRDPCPRPACRRSSRPPSSRPPRSRRRCSTDLQLEHQLLDRATYLKVLADKAKRDQGPPARREADRRPQGHRRVADRRARRGGHGWPRRPGRHADAEGRRRRGPRGQRPRPLLGQHGEQRRRHREAGRRGDLRPLQRRHRAGLGPDRRRPRDPDRRSRRLAARAPSRSPTARATGRAAKAAKSAREELGDVSADELPIKNYDKLTVADAIKAIKGLKTPHDINVVIHYEETHKDRSNVASAAQTQLADLAKEAVGVSS